MHIKFFLSLIFALMLHAVPAFAMNCGTCNAAIEGKICYASDDKTLMLCNGSTWVNQSASCGLALSPHSCGTCNTGNNGKICYENTAGLTFFCNGTTWRGTRQMTPARSTSANVCGYTERGVIGTWNGHNVDTRQFTRNGQNEWVLTVAITGSSVDKHFPRGDNFLSSVTLSGSFNSSCLNGGETAWYGLSKPSGLTTPAHYEAGTEADGAEFFQHKGYCGSSGPVQCFGDPAKGGTTPNPIIIAKSLHGLRLNSWRFCAIKTDNKPYCLWIGVPNIEVKDIAVGGDSYCAIKLDNTVQCWGSEYYGGITPSPTISAKQLVASPGGMCAIKMDDSVQCWGSFGTPTPSPVRYMKSLQASGSGFCGIQTNNIGYCFGSNSGSAPSGTIKQIFSTPYTVHNICGIALDDTVVCSSPTPPTGLKAKTIALAAINMAAVICAINLSDDVVCWGTSSSARNSMPTIKAKSIIGGSNAFCAIKTNDEVQCWGDATSGGTAPSPTITAKHLFSGSSTNMCALQLNNTVRCWPTNRAFRPYDHTTPNTTVSGSDAACIISN